MINQTLEEVIRQIQKSISFNSFYILFDDKMFLTGNQKYFDFNIKDSFTVNFEEYYKSFYLDKPEFIFKINEENEIKDCKLSILLKSNNLNINVDFYVINNLTEKSSAFQYKKTKQPLIIDSSINNNTFKQFTLVKDKPGFFYKNLLTLDTFTPLNKIDRLIENLIFI